MHPSSCAGSVVSFKTRMLILFRLDFGLVLRASVVNLAHVYPLRFKTRMPINVRLDFGLVLWAAVVNLAQNPLLSFCRPVLLGGSLPLSLPLRFYLFIPVALATMHPCASRLFTPECEADLLPPAKHIRSSP